MKGYACAKFFALNIRNKTVTAEILLFELKSSKERNKKRKIRKEEREKVYRIKTRQNEKH